jgi:AcrR family transcriptional regulator
VVDAHPRAAQDRARVAHDDIAHARKLARYSLRIQSWPTRSWPKLWCGCCVTRVLTHGLTDMSLHPLAAAIGSSPRVLLYLFGSKEGLIRALLARARADELALLSRVDHHSGTRLGAVAEQVWTWLIAEEHRPLPFPADQVVAALILTFDSPDLNADPALAMRLLAECMEAAVAVDGRDLATYVDGLLAGVGVEPVVPPGSRRPAGMPLERHQLVFIRDLRDAGPVHPDTVRRMLNGSRPRFNTLVEPAGLSEDGSYGAVGGRASFLCGHSADVEISVFLTTVQAVGTASRFQQIWQEAYYRVQEFQDKKQRKEIGIQQREDMAELADRMGNLELDLAFSVQTAADLGLNPSIRIDSFHEALYQVMQVEVRARTVGEMFNRLGGSIQSELTAIESRERQEEERHRERQEEDRRRGAGALALGILAFIIAPVTFLLGFFGMNVSQVHDDGSMWDTRTYLWAYIVAGLLAAIPLLTVLLLRSISKRRAK